MNKKEILKETGKLKLDLGDIAHKLVHGLENIGNSAAGTSLLTSEEYSLLRERARSKQGQLPFSGITDVGGEIKKNLKALASQVTNTSLLVSMLFHESESSSREYELKNLELKRQLENYQVELCFLERELEKYKY